MARKSEEICGLDTAPTWRDASAGHARYRLVLV